MNSKEVAKKLRCSVRRVNWLCQEGRVVGAEKRMYPIPYWVIPEGFRVLPTTKVIGNPKLVKKKPEYVVKPQKWTVL